MTGMDDFLDSWVDVGEILPGLGTEPFFVAGERQADLRSQVLRFGFEVVEVNLADLENDEDFVVEFGQAIGVPSYFGGNWDALRDVLRRRTPESAWKIALIVVGGREFAKKNLHEYVRIVSTLRIMSEQMSDIDSPVGQLEVFYIDG